MLPPKFFSLGFGYKHQTYNPYTCYNFNHSQTVYLRWHKNKYRKFLIPLRGICSVGLRNACLTSVFPTHGSLCFICITSCVTLPALTFCVILLLECQIAFDIQNTFLAHFLCSCVAPALNIAVISIVLPYIYIYSLEDTPEPGIGIDHPGL